MKSKNIHNLETLEKEMYRLDSEAKKIEEKIENNFDHLQKNYPSMLINSLCQKNNHPEKSKNSFFDLFFKNENFNAAVNKITDHVASRAEESIETLIDKLFHKKKQDQ